METQEQAKTEKKPRQPWRVPEWQYCHQASYSGDEHPKWGGRRMSIAITPTGTPNQYLVAYSVASFKDSFSRKKGRMICKNRIEKHRQMLNTRGDYIPAEQYSLSSDSGKPIADVVRYAHANVVTVTYEADDFDGRDHIAIITQLFDVGYIHC